MRLQISIFIVVFSIAGGFSSRVKGTSNSVLVSYDGQLADLEDKLGLKLRRKVLTRYEFIVPSSVDIDQLIESHREIEIQKLTHQHKTKKAVPISDAKWSDQWQLQTSQSPSMNVYNAWDKGFTGSGITIAIVDDGIDVDHGDLSGNYNAGLSYDIIYDIADPSHFGPYDGHGTNCAGVVAAVKNTVCIVGVAYEASIPAIRILDYTYPATEAEEALALTHELSSIDIYSNSWGPSDDGETFFSLSSIQREALQTGVTGGRGGKGVIYSWASGNGGDYDDCNADGYSNNIYTILSPWLQGRGGKGVIYSWASGNGGDYDDCNADGYSNSIYTIAIGAVSETSAPTWYSEHCTAILAATYSGDFPNARIATTGPSNTCVNDFSGTSSACPLASGIFALTLQANPALTWRDMQHMLVEYSISSGLHADANFYTNAAGKTVSHWFGFGLMDAEAMVDNAPSWKNVPSSTICSSTQINVDINSVTSSIVSTYSASQCCISNLEHVIVTIRYRASRRGNVEFFIDSPSGTRSKIFRSRTNDLSSSSITWDFMSVHTWGENPEGDWTLTMSDAIGGTSMNLYYWSIQFYGTVTDPLAGIPAAGEIGGSCIDSSECSAITDGGCLQDCKICVVCNDGYRVIDIYCKQDGQLGGYCDDSVTCATTDSGCLQDGNICVVCNDGYRVIDIYCKQDGQLGGYCDDSVTCATTDSGCLQDGNICVVCNDGYRVIDVYCKQDGQLGGYCDDSVTCATTDSGCLQDGNICVVCNDGYRVIDVYCKQDGQLGAYCDDSVTCATTSLDCINNVCEEKEQDEETDNTPLIVGAVIGACVGIALLVGAGYILHKVCFGVKATSAVTPAPYVLPPVYPLEPSPYSSSGAAANQQPQTSYAHPTV
ncbi:neuroendocrine convertase 2-like [Ruditapes philippinarum]|uniref:neuroendocrine convertase 2-like n=1 Tax=Ruditapes philippinarum TaxID=129788 RepID=UPI00295A89C6|nr:neuroendocrine convertase 2-like [Ruditapes philippinarum]